MQAASYKKKTWISCALILACCGPVAGSDTTDTASESGTTDGATGGTTFAPTTVSTSSPPTTTVDPSGVTVTTDPTVSTVTTVSSDPVTTDPVTSDPTITTTTTTDPTITTTSTTDPSSTSTTTTTDSTDSDSDTSTGPVQMFTPLALEVQDFDGDGERDLLVMGVDNFDGTVGRLSLGLGDGTFKPAIDAGLSGASAFPVVGELDGTPGVDVMLAQQGGDVEVFRWNGDTFVSWKLFTNANVPRTHVVNDFDADDDDDIVWLWWTKDSLEFGLSVRPNGGGFFFAPVDSKLGPIADIGIAPGSLLVGRLDAGDAADALIFEADKPKGFLRVFGNKMGVFGQPKFVLPALRPWVATLGDFDEDGDQDILMIERDPARLVLALGDGAGGFTVGTSVPVVGPFKPLTLAVADLDGDTHLDVAVVDDLTPELRQWSGDGKGAFAGPSVTALPAPAVRVIAAPLDADAKPDLILATFAAGDVTIVLSP